MAFWKKKLDPLSARARALNAEIRALEAEIRRLDAQLSQKSVGSTVPRLRSTALPRGQVVTHSPPSQSAGLPSTPAPAAAATSQGEPVFEEVDRSRLKDRAATESTPAHFNELGVRKYDLPALWARIHRYLRGPTATNPKLVSYLAAGGFQGPRSLRYERRVARNRLMAMVAVLFLVLLGVISFLVRNR